MSDAPSAPRADPTPRAAGLAGCSLPARRATAGLAALPFALATALVLAGCGRGEQPRVRVVNLSGQRLDAIWVRTQRDSVRVPPLAPGDSVEVRPRVRGEDLLWVTGRFGGRRIESYGGDYVEGTAGYRFRAVVDSAGRAHVKFIRMGIW